MALTDTAMEKRPLEWARMFEVAGRTGNITVAAHQVGLTQAAASQQIAHLESCLGARLFSRQASGVTLTVEGEAWLPSAFVHNKPPRRRS